ncbi:uncharacterized protein LOC135963006 [Calliphora vicina]|uniref:uncharacterized protein LOC135963006 n=1 Tax=Calliphora vicina TaxID=7373 RepID=UPI00325BE098
MRQHATTSRANETPPERELRIENMRHHATTSRANETPSEREGRLQGLRHHATTLRANETSEQREARMEAQRIQTSSRRAAERSEQQDLRRMAVNRRNTCDAYARIAFNYRTDMDYANDILVAIGPMNVVCQYCNAHRYKNEAPGMCSSNGKIVLPDMLPPPEPLKSLISGTSEDSRNFLSNIRKYNSCFQMTSFGATKVVRDNYMPTFRVQGQIYHLMGSILPIPNEEPKFLQIYFMGQADDNVQVQQRQHYNPGTKQRIVAELQVMFHENNELIRTFKQAKDDPRLCTDDHVIAIHADKTPAGQHQGRYNAPTMDDVAILMVGDPIAPRDIIIRRRDDRTNRIAETHRSYDALQYPIILPYGEDGYHFELRQINPATNVTTRKKVSAMDFYAYRIMIRQNVNHVLNCRELFHQYIVDMYAKIETERLLYIRRNQAKLRVDNYIHLRDALNNQNYINPNELGQAIILPATFTGSPRHMQEYCQDAMTYVRSYGRPDLFITFTCNPKWNEIISELSNGQKSAHRHDITARVFKQKLKSLMDFIVKCHVFGETRCWMYSVEWQKRGLPHAHILIWLVEKITPNLIDNIISAEIPDPNIDPDLHEIVIKNMIHGPCGIINTHSPCMVDGKCTKKYPRQLLPQKISGNDGYPLYRRRSVDDGGQTISVKINENDVDNRWIVPYCPLLSKTFKAHINVEYCHSVKSIKYICKYVTKGSDMAIFSLQNPNDEITQYQMARYISSNEAVWRILGFPIHERHPTVVHLSVHLENGQRVYFTEGNARERATEPPATTLTSFFDLCRMDLFAKTLLYSEIPTYYTWNASTRKFQRRKQGKPVAGWPNLYSTDALGRVYTVHPQNSECFYLRLLLINVPGPTYFENLRTVDGEICATYREACQKLQLLENDSHWETTLADAAAINHPSKIRTLFAIILVSCSPANPKELWNKFKTYMAEDILHRERVTTNNATIELNERMYNEALILLEDKCLEIKNVALIDVGMISPIRSRTDAHDQDLRRERDYNTQDLESLLEENLPHLQQEQRIAYNTTMAAISNKHGGLYFIDAPGGTGKTFLISLILAKVRSQKHIALAIASSGIAATLLDGGRTAHSALKLPLKPQFYEDYTCNIKKNSSMGKVLQQCEIIVWDECTMAHKKSLEALDRTLQDLRSNNKIFGGALVLLAGDFRQTLPVIPGSTPADELNACLKSSYLWKHVHTLKLTTNMRVQLQRDASASTFSKQLLDLGNGKMPIHPTTKCITFPSDFCRMTQSIQELINCVFPNIGQNFKNKQWLCERVLLAAKNIDVNSINSNILNTIDGNLKIYKSIDTVTNIEDVVNYPVEFLNSLDLPGFPPHDLQLKIGAPIILLRNIDPPRLCNGTRLIVKKLMNNLIEATIITGKYNGSDVLLPRIPMITSEMPFDFKRLQFPIRLAFAMTINKAQGQSLQVCGLNLENPCFSHGQLYVACSRVGKPTDLYVYAPEGKTKNIVYPKALE